MPMRNLGNYKTKMKVTWDEEEGYHRLSDNDNMSVLVTELGELEDKDISFICQQLNIIVHTHRKRLFAEIRKKGYGYLYFRIPIKRTHEECLKTFTTASSPRNSFPTPTTTSSTN